LIEGGSARDGDFDGLAWDQVEIIVGGRGVESAEGDVDAAGERGGREPQAVGVARFGEIHGDLRLGQSDEFSGDEVEDIAGDGFAVNEEIGDGENVGRVGAIGIHKFRKWPLNIDFAGEFGNLDLLRGIRERFSRKSEEAQAQTRGGGRGLIGDHIDVEIAVLDMGRDEQRTIEAARVILQGLPAAEIVNAGPGSYRPTIVELPKDRAHGARAKAPQMLRADLDAFGLKNLAGVEERREIARLGIILEHVIMNDRIAFGVFLMGEHHGSEDAGAILGLSEGFHGAHFGEGLKAILGHEAREVLFVFGEGNAPVPDAPIVEIAGLEAG